MSEAPLADLRNNRTRLHLDRCHRCDHQHKYISAEGEREVTYLVPCPECGCQADESGYDHDPIDLDAYADTGVTVTISKQLADEWGWEYHDTTTTIASACNGSWDDFHNPAELSVNVGHRDAPRTPTVVPSSDLRRGWLDRLIGFCVSRLGGDLSSQLVRERGHVGRVRGRPDHGGGTNPAGPAGSNVLRGVVKP